MADWPTPAGISDADWQALLAMYPTAAGIISKPGVAAVLVPAAQQHWAPGRVQAALEGTDYWKQTNDNERKWDVTWATDPAEAARQQQDAVTSLKDMMGRLNLNLGTQDFFHTVENSVREGWTQQELYNQLVTKYVHGVTDPGGEVGQMMGQVKSWASDYGLPLADGVAIQDAQQILTGAGSKESVQGNLREVAASLYPHMKPILDQGLTLKQWATPYITVAANDLGISPDTIKMDDPKWAAMFQQPTDPNSKAVAAGPNPGQSSNDPAVALPLLAAQQQQAAANPSQFRPMTLQEWQNKIRMDPTYGYQYSDQAKTQAGQLGAKIASAFGVG